jgi:hypothetical protein
MSLTQKSGMNVKFDSENAMESKNSVIFFSPFLLFRSKLQASLSPQQPLRGGIYQVLPICQVLPHKKLLSID